ncbi:hypothetical protein CK203_042850 [Vitis vinifera]|uniref:Uncharacterized protein n=1 Tax=Vitis vinifera TaxID=29760 RepID=A0A438HUN4_VITVI|nr:hypothetical protein CK203_042850 [Vitis vinifera]
MPTQSFDKASVKILLLINPKFKLKNSIPEPYCQATHEVVKWEISTQDRRQCWRESANRRLLRILTFMATLVGHGDGAFDTTTGDEARSSDREFAEKVKKGASGRKGGGPKKNPVSRSIKTGLQFPVDRIEDASRKVVILNALESMS